MWNFVVSGIHIVGRVTYRKWSVTFESSIIILLILIINEILTNKSKIWEESVLLYKFGKQHSSNTKFMAIDLDMGRIDMGAFSDII